MLRNQIVVGVFRDPGGRYIEQLGTGRIARVMEAHGLPRPRFDVVGSEFRALPPSRHPGEVPLGG